jgi:excisionase family DNA binding protein
MDTAEIIVAPEERSAPESAALRHTEEEVSAYLTVLEGGKERRPTAPKLVLGNGKQIELSNDALRALRFVLRHMARGEAFALIPTSQTLSTTEAARILNVSRPYLVQLLTRGEIAHTMVGSHHRMRVEDVLAYKNRQYERMESGLARMAAEAQESGDYFNE